MTNLSASLVLLLVGVAAVAAASTSLVAPRLIGGVPIDTLRRFPHHCTIEPIRYQTVENKSICGGSILNEQWILTSARCIDGSSRLQLHFERLYLNDTIGSYTLIVEDKAVVIYPTYFDDIALVKLPVRLVFSDLIKPISLNSVSPASLQNKLTVLPGFDTVNYKSSQLTYAMLTIIENTQCMKHYDVDNFDEFLQFCTVGWSGNSNTPCLEDQGSGLIVGWPAKSELVGIYSGGNKCGTDYPAIYTNVAKYASWINSVIAS